MRTRFGQMAAMLTAVVTFGALAACGSNGSAAAPATTSSASASTHASSGGTVTIDTATGSDGTYLTDSSGRALYLWVADKNGKSTCNGACASAWPPLTTTGHATAGSGVKSSELGTVSRSGGATQVTYDGHPLYYFAGDQGAHQVNGQGSDGFGAKWWLVAPSGAAITTTGSAASTSASAGGGYQY